MKNLFIFLSFILLLFSCGETDQSESTVEDDKNIVKETSAEKIHKNKPLTAKQVKDSTFSTNYNRKLFFKSRSDFESYSFLKVIDRKHQINAQDSLFKMHEAQNITVNYFDSTLIIEYSLMTYCHNEYETSVTSKKNNLYLTYSKLGDEYCDGYMGYRYIF